MEFIVFVDVLKPHKLIRSCFFCSFNQEKGKSREWWFLQSSGGERLIGSEVQLYVLFYGIQPFAHLGGENICFGGKKLSP